MLSFSKSVFYAKITSPNFCKKNKATKNETLFPVKIAPYVTKSTRDFDSVYLAKVAKQK